LAVTLKQVAADAGVSYQTVWRALHGSPGILPETRDHVLEVATRLGYRANSIARSLRMNQSSTIGVIVLDVSNAFTSALVSGIEGEASRNAHSIILMNSGDDIERERRAVSLLMGRQVDGLIINPSSLGSHAYLRDEMPAGFPLVAVNRAIPGVPCTTVESRHADTVEAARHLIALGHTRIGGIFGSFSNTPFYARSAALRAEIKRAGLSVRSSWFRAGENTVEFARQAVREIVSARNPPTALFAAGNRLTEGALLGLRDLGLRQGEDIGLVGFDLRYAGLLRPPMPVLVQPAHEMGRLAFQLLLQIRRGEMPQPAAPLPLRLMVGGQDDVSAKI
jgi:LacI family transcriptional regulator